MSVSGEAGNAPGERKSPRSPELDYAFLASWAGLQADGTMTAVGMSFLRVAKQETPMTLAVAGRVRLFDEVPEAQLKISIATPSGVTIEVTNALVAASGSDTRYGDDRRQVLFVLNTQLPIDHLGAYKVAISLEVLDSIRPSVTTFVQRQSAPMGVASPQGVLETCT